VGIDEVGRKLRAWTRAHLPELAAFGLGVLLRLSMALTFDARVGYDFNAHWPHIQYIVERHALPPLAFNATSAHAPLYYLIAAAAVALGLGPGALGWLSAFWGVLRLALIWVGLERWLTASRLARVVALALAAVLPIGVHLDGMITNETLVMLMSAAVLVVAPAAIAAAREGRVAPVAGLALLLGLAVLSKVSATVLVFSIAAAIGLEIARARASWWQALRARLRPLVVATLVLAVVAGPFFARNVALYGQVAPTAYEGSVKANQASYEKIPYFERRPLDFTFGWHLGIYRRPFFTTGLKPEARFFPVLIASTFNDYYVFSYWGGGKYGDERWVPGIGVLFGIISNIAGTAVSLVTVIAWLGAVRTLWRRREDGRREAGTIDPRFALLLMPLGALLGQLHFATKYPNDNFGPIKGAYLQFIAPVLCALFGVGVDWMWRRRARWGWRAAALAAMAAVLCIAVYSVGARLPRFGAYANTAAPFFQPQNPERVPNLPR
jgi:4-amino-4-deoxy-L-arabinose transferase-like glycosyltransferase